MMPDISMCSNDECPLAKRCYRHEAKPGRNQSYMDFRPDESGNCADFEPLRERKERQG